MLSADLPHGRSSTIRGRQVCQILQDKPVIKFVGGVNEIQHIQCSLIEIAKEQFKDEVWSEVISWVEKGKLPEKTRDKAKDFLVECSMFDPESFKMKDGVFTKAANKNRIEEVWQICLPESMVKEVWSL